MMEMRVYPLSDSAAPDATTPTLGSSLCLPPSPCSPSATFRPSNETADDERPLVAPAEAACASEAVQSDDVVSEAALVPPNSTGQDVTSEINPVAKHFKLWERFGILGLSLMIVGLLGIFASVILLVVFWCLTFRNTVWRTVVLNGWATRVVTLSSVMLRTSMGVHFGVATSMLAGLALERDQVLLCHLASVSGMRNVNTGPYWLLWVVSKPLVYSFHRTRRLLLPVLVLLLTIISVLSEFISTALVSDLQPDILPGWNHSQSIATNYKHGGNGTFDQTLPIFAKRPALYPLYAEYHEDSAAGSGYADTGLTLRSFLPYPDQVSRQTTRNFTSQATVIDISVRCEARQLTELRLHYRTGFVGLSFRLYGDQIFQDGYACVLPLPDPISSSTAWPLSLCQLGSTVLPSPNIIPGTSAHPPRTEVLGYLVVNSTSGTNSWKDLLQAENNTADTFTSEGLPPVNHVQEGEWLQYAWDSNASLVLGTSFCHTPLIANNVAIDIYTESTRIEPAPVYNASMPWTTYKSIRTQMGQNQDFDPAQFNLDSNDRAILRIKRKSSWLPENLTDFNRSFLFGTDLQYAPIGSDSFYRFFNLTAFMTDQIYGSSSWAAYKTVVPDSNIISLIQEILHSGGDLAHALQSLLTVFASEIYYDTLPYFDDVRNISRTGFETAVQPRAFMGLAGVLVLVGVHLILMFWILALFLLYTKVSTVGNSWMNAAQVIGGQTKDILDASSLATDADIAKTAAGKKAQSCFVVVKRDMLVGETEGQSTTMITTVPHNASKSDET
jgi:hypothetical protein